MVPSMTVARRLIVDPARPGCYHLVSRCVRRAFLCGDGLEHRKVRLEQRIKAQFPDITNVFVEVQAREHQRPG